MLVLMDRRLDPQSRWNRDRRVASGPRLARLLITGEPVTFDELLAAAEPASTADVATWVSHTLAGGLIEEVEPGTDGRRRFRLRRAEAESQWTRRDADGSGSGPR
jgi:hypothetical protein